MARIPFPDAGIRIRKLPTKVPARFAAIALPCLAATAIPSAAVALSPEAAANAWLLAGALAAAACIGGIVAALVRPRTRGRTGAASGTRASGAFGAEELERYARHIILREIGGPGQARLRKARVLVVGAGGLGSPALMYLAAGGVGTIGVIDADMVDRSNLQRQIVHSDARAGLSKAMSAREAMTGLNPHVEVIPHDRRLVEENAGELIAGYDLVLDGCDNFETRYLANRVCASLGKPLIGGAISQWEGQISIFDPASGTPCYQCVFPEAPAPGLAPSCAEAGVLGPLPGVVGSMMAVEAIKAIVGAGEGLKGRMLIYDALFGETRVVRLKSRADCPVCGGKDAQGVPNSP